MPRSLLVELVVLLLAAAGFIATPPALIGDAAVPALPDDNEGRERYWSTSYPSAIIVEVMRLVDLANTSLPLQIDQSILTLLSPNDQVVSHQATIEALRRIDRSMNFCNFFGRMRVQLGWVSKIFAEIS